MRARYLLDTNVLIWAVQHSDRLSGAQVAIIEDQVQLATSIASFWEIAIKQSLGKLRIDGDIYEVVRQRSIPVIAISPEHLDVVKALPHHHRDPFDRMLIAQAQVEGLSILSADRHFAAYGIAVV